jgi:hypothetical protein
LDITQLLKNYPGVELFDEVCDQEEAFQIFTMIPMKLPGLNLIYDRSPTFLSLLKAQAPEFQTFIGRHEGKMLGFASLAWGPRWLKEEKKIVSYIGDLRVVPVKEAKAMWKQFYPALLDCSKEVFGIDYHLTAVLSDNKFALKSLVEEGRKRSFKYHPLKPTTMVNILSKNPLSPYPALRPQEHIRKISVMSSEMEKVLTFMDQSERKKIFGHCLKESEWARRLKTWDGLQESSLYLFENEKGLRATCLPWSANALKRLKVNSMKGWLKAGLVLPRLLGLPFPKNDEALKIVYLTHLYFAEDVTDEERALILNQFIQEMRTQDWIKKATFISYADPWGIHRHRLMKKFFLQKTPVNLYAVTREGESLSFPYAGEDVGFEMSLA